MLLPRKHLPPCRMLNAHKKSLLLLHSFNLNWQCTEMKNLPIFILSATLHAQVDITIRGAEEGSFCTEEEGSKMVCDTQTSEMSWAPAGEHRSKLLLGLLHNAALNLHAHQAI